MKMILHPHKHNHPCIPIIFLMLVLQVTMPYANSKSQDALLKFKQSLSNATALLSWDPLIPPCYGRKNNWVGLICSKGGNVYGLRLEIMGLSGKIDIGILSQIRQLRSISFMNNKLDGPIPNIKNLKALKSIYLSNNRFEGQIDPETLSGLHRLRKLHLANNKFTGHIPISLTKLPKLIELRLDGNQFQGRIPNFTQTSFNDLSLANNHLEGLILVSLSRMSPNTFVGNKGLCEMPLNSCQGVSKPIVEYDNERKKSIPLVPIAVSIVLLFTLLLVAMTIKKCGRRHKPWIKAQSIDLAPTKMLIVEKEAQKSTDSRVTQVRDLGKLYIMRENGDRFDLLNLLRASAEILGSGCLGSSYKANLVSDSMMVVKRFKQMNNVSKEEFDEHMIRIGRLQHKNVVSLVAYYYRKEEKLLVTNFVQGESLAIHLHGNHTRGHRTLDWPTRLHIIKGVTRGLSYIYKELGLLIAPHGHLKSSNVLMDELFNPLIHDYGLIPLINQGRAHKLMIAYKSPEYITKGHINMKTDVWSLGILIIEIMTGQFPAIYLQQGSEVDLSTWVKKVVGDDYGKVFDKHMGGSMTNCEGEMHKILKIGLAYCESDVAKRWDITYAYERIEEVKERDNDVILQ